MRPSKPRRRELRRKWREARTEEPKPRPGARFYVTVRDGRRVGFLLGPYASHMTALANVRRGRLLAEDARPDETAFASFGTASCPRTRRTVFGR